jgi:type I restriction enzyme M protein
MKLERTQPITDWWNNRQEIISDEVGEKSRRFTIEELISRDCNFDQYKFPKEDEEVLPPAELLADYFKKRAAFDHEIDKTLAEIQQILGIDLTENM